MGNTAAKTKDFSVGDVPGGGGGEQVGRSGGGGGGGTLRDGLAWLGAKLHSLPVCQRTSLLFTSTCHPPEPGSPHCPTDKS